MSSTEIVDKVRERIVRLAREIEQLANSSLPPDEFFQQFLDLLVSALGARGGAVWLRNADHHIHQIADVAYADMGIHASPEATRLNEKLLADVLSTGEARCHGPDDESDVKLPSPHVIVLAALHSQQECVGVVEIFQRADAPRAARAGYLQFVEQTVGYASRYLLMRERGPSDTSPAQFWQDFVELSLLLQSTLNVKEVAATAVNDLRLLLKCDRVSIAWKRGRRTSIEAISGQDAVNPRANLVRNMSSLAAQVIQMRETFTYNGTATDLAPQIEKPLSDYIAESGSRMVMLIPLLEPEPLVQTKAERDEHKDRNDHKEPFGCMIVEQVSESEPADGLDERAHVVAESVAAAMFNARAHQRVFLLSLWTFLGRCREWFYGRKLLKTLAALLVLAAVTAVLAFVPWEYRVEAEGRLMPVVQKEVFAPWDGEIVEIKVKGGERVEKGSTLLVIQNDDLHARRIAVSNELNNKRHVELSLNFRIVKARDESNKEEALRLSGERERTIIEIEGLEEQERNLIEREERLTVKAPISGVVATFQLEQTLRDRPVRRGEILLQLMDDKGPWRLELDIEEHRMGHVLHARQRSDRQQLPLKFILATATDRSYRGKLNTISTRPKLQPEKGSVVQVLASIDDLPLKSRRIGAEVTAKIECGQRSLGYVLFGDVVDFIRQRFWW